MPGLGADLDGVLARGVEGQADHRVPAFRAVLQEHRPAAEADHRARVLAGATVRATTPPGTAEGEFRMAGKRAKSGNHKE
jgi:hypothetical protein